jgi:hypothetical protein
VRNFTSPTGIVMSREIRMGSSTSHYAVVW